MHCYSFSTTGSSTIPVRDREVGSQGGGGSELLRSNQNSALVA